MSADHEVVSQSVSSIDEGQAIAVGGPGLDHEQRHLDRRQDAMHQDPVELEH